MSRFTTREHLESLIAGSERVVSQRITGDRSVADERWVAHHALHQVLESSLERYKRDSNEWRGSLNDLRVTFLSRDEYHGAHKALETQLETTVAAMEARLVTLDKAVQSINDRDNVTRDVLSSGRNLIVVAFTIIGGLVALALYLSPHA